ncbi:MAG TPA: hypothetical protein VGB55_12125, partial [Tepidisphaeraceae bacterium]
MRGLYQRILDLSPTAFTRIPACGLIGSIVFALATRRAVRAERVDIEWWQGALLGGAMGLCAGTLLTLIDIARDKTKAR